MEKLKKLIILKEDNGVQELFCNLYTCMLKTKSTREQRISYMKCYKLTVYMDESHDPFSEGLV
jgi:hypothetical protein